MIDAGSGNPPEFDEDDRTPAILSLFTNGYRGRGWFYWAEEYPEEGSVGPFNSRAEALSHLAAADYVLVREGSISPPVRPLKCD